MSLLSVSAIAGNLLAAVGSETELPIPPWGFAAIAFAVFLLLAFVMWSFRDVANRHSHKTGRGTARDASHTSEHD